MTDMTPEEQLRRWVAGESIHVGKRCVPDGTCCKPLNTPATPEERAVFLERYEAGDFETLFILGIAMAIRSNGLGDFAVVEVDQQTGLPDPVDLVAALEAKGATIH